MKLKVQKTIVSNSNDKISWDTFRFLIGKPNLNLEKRIGKIIELIKKRGHIYIYDENPIPEETYKLDNIIYYCSFAKDKEALLKRLDNKLYIKTHKGSIEIA